MLTLQAYLSLTAVIRAEYFAWQLPFDSSVAPFP